MHKYRAVRATCAQNHKHPSKAEALRCDQLHIMERAGVITDLQSQAVYYFPVAGDFLRSDSGRKISYTADFVYRDEATGSTVVEDVKGVRTAAYMIKKSLMRAVHNVEVFES